MANYILKNENIILRFSCGAMGLLHDYLLKTIESEQIEVSCKLKEFIGLLDQDVYGSGAIWVELDEHLPKKEDRIMLKTLVSKIIDRFKEEKILRDEFAPYIIEGLEGFRDKILDD